MKTDLTLPALLLGFLLLWGCSPKTIQTSSVGADYYEDLSLYRPSYYASEEGNKPDDGLVVRDVMITHDQTEEIDTLLSILAAQNQGLKHVQGFTVQIYSGTSRDKASKSRMEVMRVVPGFEAQVQYVQPNFKVKVGKFVDRLEAQWLYSQVKSDFPEAIIIPERIRLDD